MSWEDARRAKEGSKTIKMKDGDEVMVVFREEPYTFYQGYPDKNEYQDWAEGRSRRFKIACVVKENDEYTGKVFFGSKTTLVTLFNCNEEYGMDCVYKVKRQGSDKDTVYAILFKKDLTPEELTKVNAVTLPSLSSGRARTEEAPPLEDEDFNQETDVPEELEELPF